MGLRRDAGEDTLPRPIVGLPSVPSGTRLYEAAHIEEDTHFNEGCKYASVSTSQHTHFGRDRATSSTSQHTHSGRDRATSSTSASTKDSSWRFAEPAQTLIFLDWDDTLFPSTELFQRQHFCKHSFERKPQRTCSPEVDGALSSDLEKWSVAVHKFLCLARATGDRVAVITNSKRPWVTDCIDKFAPHLRPLFDDLNSTLHIVYAQEVTQLFGAGVGSEDVARSSSSCWGACGKWMAGFLEEDGEHQRRQDDKIRQLTMAKHDAMKREAAEFYSSYPGQTWKNILCMGDAKFEHDAVRELASDRSWVCPQRERLRIKTVVTPKRPAILELALHLEFSCLLLRAYAGWDGNFDLNLNGGDPLSTIASTLDMPQLRSLPVPQATWALAEEAVNEEVAWEALDQVAIVVQEWETADRFPAKAAAIGTPMQGSRALLPAASPGLSFTPRGTPPMSPALVTSIAPLGAMSP